MLGMGRKQPPKPTEAMKLAACVQAAADEFDSVRERWETIQIAFRGIAIYINECESDARLRGSPSAAAFSLVGKATKAFSLGTTRMAAALPPADPKSEYAAKVLLGLREEESEDVDA